MAKRVKKANPTRRANPRVAATKLVKARLTPETKSKAESVLKSQGLDTSAIIRMMFTKIANDGAVPFEMFIPNATTIAAMEAVDRGEVIKAGSVKDLMTDLNASG